MQHGPLWMAEHKIVVGPASAHQQPLSSLPRSVLAKRSNSALVEGDGAPPLRCFRRADHHCVFDGDHALSDEGSATVEVQILPAQPQRFPPPETSCCKQEVRRPKTTSAGSLEERA